MLKNLFGIRLATITIVAIFCKMPEFDVDLLTPILAEFEANVDATVETE